MQVGLLLARLLPEPLQFTVDLHTLLYSFYLLHDQTLCSLFVIPDAMLVGHDPLLILQSQVTRVSDPGQLLYAQSIILRILLGLLSFHGTLMPLLLSPPQPPLPLLPFFSPN